MPANLTLGVCFSSELPLLPLLPPLCYITTTTSLSTHTAHDTYFLSKYSQSCRVTPLRARVCQREYSDRRMKRPIDSYPYCLHHCTTTACWSATLYPLSLHPHSYHNAHTHIHTHAAPPFTSRTMLTVCGPHAQAYRLTLNVSTTLPGPPICVHILQVICCFAFGFIHTLPKTQNTNTHQI